MTLARPRTPLRSTLTSSPRLVAVSLLPICCFLFPVLFPPPSLRSVPLPALLVSFTPPFHPSNVGGQQNNIAGVTATGGPLPVVSSCHCPCSYCRSAPALYQPSTRRWSHSFNYPHVCLHQETQVQVQPLARVPLGRTLYSLLPIATIASL